jgi:zinc D-Ala-D-Ala carboxypeptidase
MSHEYQNYANYPADKWRWENFKPIEMRSKGDNKLMIDEEAMDKLQALRTLIGKPIKITSAYRSPAHNKSVGGAKGSQHLKAKAFDCQMPGHDPGQFEAAARRCGFYGFGFYESSNFIHIDIGPPREWGTRWFKKVDVLTTPTIDVPPSQGKRANPIMAFIMAIINLLKNLKGMRK